MPENKEDKKNAEIAAGIIKEFERLRGERGNFETHWKEIAERIWPNQKNLFQQHGSLSSPGEKRTQELYDSTAAIALNRFGSILDSLLTPRNQTWHRTMPSDKNLLKDRETKLWFEDLNRALFKYRYAPKANFASQNQQNYKSLGAYGTGCVFIDKLANDTGIRYRNLHLGEIYFVENHQGIVDKAVRYFPLTVRQAHQKWGDKLPDRLKSILAVNPETNFYFIHCVKPREDVDYERADYKGMPYASYYISVEGQAFLEEGGYTVFPYAISRYEQVPGEVYGRGPAMDVLPAIKTLNEQKKIILKQGHRATDPVLLVHDDGILDTFSLKPGALNAGGVTADGRPLVHTLPIGRVDIGKDLMDDERAVINDAFLITIFQILTDSPAMTATEVLERTKEKGILLAPTIGRQQSEYLGPLIEREIDILMSQGLIGRMPDALIEAKGEYRIEYDSPLSRAQRAEEAAGIARTMETALRAIEVTQNPEPLDHFNWDTIIPEIADIQGVPASWMRSAEEVQALREGRAEQQQTQEIIQGAPAAAAMIKATAAAQK
ncbi:MAG: phage head-tail adapter protein [Nitrosomonas sp.]|nr:phage head-tail adapter protein [Nitrosomonas sp.]